MDSGRKESQLPVPAEQVTLAIEGWNAADLESREIFERSLFSLLNQTFPIRRCEILIIVDAAMDPAESAWLHKLLPEAHILQLEQATYYLSKNLAIESAHGEYLAFADSDVIYEPEWLMAMLEALGPRVELVAGNTQYGTGFLSRTLSLCDWAATRPTSGYTDWFYGNNVVMTRRVFENIHFRADIGRSGGGSVDLLRVELAGRGIRPWFCLEARGLHYLARFWQKRIRTGGYSIHYRRLAPFTPWAWVVQVPFFGPFLVIAGTLLKAWKRAWLLRDTLPGRIFGLPVYFLTISAAKAVELVGAIMVAWAPGWVNHHYGWFDIPSSTKQARVF